MTNRFHETNRRRWNLASAAWARQADGRGIWSRCHVDPTLALEPVELRWLADVAGKTVAVLGSGDNQVVFALAGMGANVTSVDFSPRQLAVAADRADSLGLQIRFVCADVTDLHDLDRATYDIVYTGGHVAVWVCDLKQYYREAARLLRPDGLLMVSEYHPFRRVWRDSPDRLEVGFRYFDRGPHRFTQGADVLREAAGDVEQYEFHWTVADYLSAVMSSGCRLIDVAEFGERRQDWEGAPMSGLPESLMMVARRIG